MSKSVLVVDTPDCCGRCRLLYRGFPFECSYTHNVIHVDSLCSHRGKDCPLRPLPQKLDANDWHRMFNGEYAIREAKGYGYNVCLDEITGETDENHI